MVETIHKIARTEKTLTQELGRQPTDNEIAEELDIPLEKIKHIKRVAQEPVSIETPIGEEGDSTLGDFLEDDNIETPEEVVAKEALHNKLEEIMDGALTDREIRIIKLRFGWFDGRPRTLEEIGNEFNVTRERIRQIEAKAMRKLRHPQRKRILEGYEDRAIKY